MHNWGCLITLVVHFFCFIATIKCYVFCKLVLQISLAVDLGCSLGDWPICFNDRGDKNVSLKRKILLQRVNLLNDSSFLHA